MQDSINELRGRLPAAHRAKWQAEVQARDIEFTALADTEDAARGSAAPVSSHLTDVQCTAKALRCEREAYRAGLEKQARVTFYERARAF
jgi:hypothetical protein